MRKETVRVVPDPGEDRVGDRLPDNPLNEREIRGVLLIPRVSTEVNDDRQNTVVVGLTAVFPKGTALAATDRIRARGNLWAVVGEPGDYGRAVMAALERVQG